MPTKPTLDPLNLETYPGHLIRRLQQISVAIFNSETDGMDITSVQFAALLSVEQNPLLDQRSLSEHIGIDPATVGGIFDRLEKRELIKRLNSPEDRRVRLIQITKKGQAILKTMIPMALAVQPRILQPLSPSEQKTFMKLLNTLVESNNNFSRAPKK